MNSKNQITCLVKSKFLLVVITFMIPMFTISQIKSGDALNPSESMSYQLFMDQNWKELLICNKKMHHQGKDYMYLRLRSGIALFHSGRYFRCIEELEKAKDFDGSNQLTIEYLFWAYIYTDQPLKAKEIYESFNASNKQKFKKTQEKLLSISLINGYQLTNDMSKNENLDIDGSSNLYGEQTFFKSAIFSSFNLNHFAGDNVTLHHQLTYQSINYGTRIQQDNKQTDLEDYDIRQLQYYLRARFKMENQFEFISAVHLINVNYFKDYIRKVPPDTFSPPLPFNPPPPPNLAPEVVDTQYFDRVFSFELNKRIRGLKGGVYVNKSAISGLKLFQVGTNLTLYPFGGIGFYSISDISYKKQLGSGGLIFNQHVGGELTNKFWWNCSFGTGNFQNSSENMGSVVYNIPDNITQKYGFGLSFIGKKGWSTSINYVYQNRTKTWFYENIDGYQSDGRPVIHRETNQSNYNNQIISLTLKKQL